MAYTYIPMPSLWQRPMTQAEIAHEILHPKPKRPTTCIDSTPIFVMILSVILISSLLVLYYQVPKLVVRSDLEKCLVCFSPLIPAVIITCISMVKSAQKDKLYEQYMRARPQPKQDFSHFFK